MNIDLDRGVTQRKHSRGFFVSMYKDDPGVYFLEDGSPCDEKLAAEAGFPIDDHYRERRTNDALKRYKRKLDQAMKTKVAKLKAMSEAELETEIANLDMAEGVIAKAREDEDKAWMGDDSPGDRVEAPKKRGRPSK